jgi:fructose-1,6-bisphosphatase I
MVDLHVFYLVRCLADHFVAGGLAVNSHMRRMLEVVPEHIHDRSGIFLGSEEEVQKVIDVHKKHEK